MRLLVSLSSPASRALATALLVCLGLIIGACSFGTGPGVESGQGIAPDVEALQVTGTAPSLTTVTLSSSVTNAFGSITAASTTTGNGLVVPTGQVSFQVSSDGGASWFTFNVKALDAGGKATSGPLNAPGAGTFQIRAVYGGDAQYSASQSAPAVLNVVKLGAGVTLRLSANLVSLGQSVTASATVLGAFGQPTGTVTFEVSADGAVTWTPLGAAKALSGSIASSDPYTAASVGLYRFRAVYNGDSGYNPTSSLWPQVEVTNRLATVTTQLSAGTVAVGSSVTDDATVTFVPVPAALPNGTVTFEVSSDGVVFTRLGAAKPLPSRLPGGVAGRQNVFTVTSDPYVPAQAGKYYFRAAYSGDALYPAARSGDLAEPLVSVQGRVVPGKGPLP